MLQTLIKPEQSDRLAVTADAKGPTFRRERYPAYTVDRSVISLVRGGDPETWTAYDWRSSRT